MSDIPTTPTPDYGEPWQIGRIDRPMKDRHGHDPLMLHRTAARAVACVNACAGLADPAAEIAASRATSTTGVKAIGYATGHATGQWMQSLHHDSAHFIVNSIPACSNADNGAKIVPGMAWLPHDGCVRKCLRCMKKVENVPALAQPDNQNQPSNT